jgi:hypothetical protein
MRSDGLLVCRIKEAEIYPSLGVIEAFGACAEKAFAPDLTPCPLYPQPPTEPQDGILLRISAMMERIRRTKAPAVATPVSSNASMTFIILVFWSTGGVRFRHHQRYLSAIFSPF